MKINSIKSLRTRQDGQTLIETIVAIFVLVTALTAGVGLAIYAFSSSSRNSQQIIATNLAREGVEVLRAMRDSNWLASYPRGGLWALTPCADIGNRLCYPRMTWAVPSYTSYNINPDNYRIQFTYATRTWDLQTSPAQYNLYEQSDGTYTHTVNGDSIYARMVKISRNTAAPYTNQNSNWELIIKSIVAWRGKGCTSFNTNQDLESLNTRCKVILEERLTNWKDYE